MDRIATIIDGWEQKIKTLTNPDEIKPLQDCINDMRQSYSKGGKPPKYETPQDLQEAIEQYFNGGYRMRKVVVGNKKEGYKEIEVPAITISDLVIYLGFCDRASFYDQEIRSAEFQHVIKRAKSFIQREYEQLLNTGNPAGAIFALKNFGWTDRQEIEHDVTERAARFVMNLGGKKE